MIGQRYLRGFTATETTELWDRWQRGESLKAIGRAFGMPSSSIYFQVAPQGGVRPAPRRRSRSALTVADARRKSPAARRLGRHDRWPGSRPLALDGEPEKAGAIAAIIDTERRWPDERGLGPGASSEAL